MHLAQVFSMICAEESFASRAVHRQVELQALPCSLSQGSGYSIASGRPMHQIHGPKRLVCRSQLPAQAPWVVWQVPNGAAQSSRTETH